VICLNGLAIVEVEWVNALALDLVKMKIYPCDYLSPIVLFIYCDRCTLHLAVFGTIHSVFLLLNVKNEIRIPCVLIIINIVSSSFKLISLDT
jgi:hypothetical protein